MKKQFAAVLAILFVVSLFTACSDGAVVATYTVGKDKKEVKIADVKAEALSYSVYDSGILTNMAWHKDFIFNRGIAYNVVLAEEIAKGLTNTPDYQKRYNQEYQKQYMIEIFHKANAKIKDDIKNAKFDVVRASHILLLTSRQTNVNGKWREMTDAEFNKVLAEKENKALNILDSLKTSKNLDKEFSNTAASLSEDGGSAPAGGDLGYFTRGNMVKEFEDAAYSMTKKGLLDKPVKTTYGIHIIYVTYPSQKKTMGEIQGMAGKQAFSRIESSFQNAYNTELKNKNVKDYYKTDLAKNQIVVDGKPYTVNSLSEDARLFDIYGKPYNWKMTKDVILLFVPNFTNNLNITNLDQQLVNLKNFITFVEYGKKMGVENNSEFKKAISQYQQKLSQMIAASSLESGVVSNAKAKITPELVRGYYGSLSDPVKFSEFLSKNMGVEIPQGQVMMYFSSVKSQMSKNVGDKAVLLSFKEVEQKIKDEMERSFIQQDFKKWSEEMTKKYNVVYNEGNIKTLMGMEKNNIADQKRKMEEQEKKRKRDEQKRMKSPSPAPIQK